MSPRASRTITSILIALVVVLLSGCSVVDDLDSVVREGSRQIEETQTPESSSGSRMTTDYVTTIGDAEIHYEPTIIGVVDYCPLDELGRTVCAYGHLTSALRNNAQMSGRQDINIDPAGWSDNDEVVIEELPLVEGSRTYSGWMWNRSHLIADSLGGDAVIENLVTGTRTQNVGSTQVEGQYVGGMAYTEWIARDYLDRYDGNNCPLYYAATPVYTGNELIPRNVLVDMRSCDRMIDVRVEVSNTANGFDIDYRTGEYTPVD